MPRESLDINSAAEKFRGMFQPEEATEESTDALREEGQENEGPQEEEVLAAQQPAEEPEGETPEEVDQESGSDDTESIELDAADLANLLKIDEDRIVIDDDGFKIKSKVDGQESALPIDDYLSSYQIRQSLDNRNREVANKEKEATEKLQMLQERLDQSEAEMQALFEHLTNQVNPYADIDWKQLREEDPAEYAAKKAEHAEWNRGIAELKSQADQRLKGMRDTVGREYAQQAEANQRAQLEALKKAVPDWGPKVEKEIIDYGVSQGASEQMMRSIAHHLPVVWAWKAMKYDNGSKEVEKAKVKKLPKVVRPQGKQKPAPDTGVKSARAKLKKSGDYRDAASVFKEMGIMRR